MFLWAGRSIEGRHNQDLYLRRVGSIQYSRSRWRFYWHGVFRKIILAGLIPRHRDGAGGMARSRELRFLPFFFSSVHQWLDTFRTPSASSSRESILLRLARVLDLSRLFLCLLLERDIPEFPSWDSWDFGISWWGSIRSCRFFIWSAMSSNTCCWVGLLFMTAWSCSEKAAVRFRASMSRSRRVTAWLLAELDSS